MMNEAVIALGSNIDPEENIPLAIESLAERFQLQKQSDFVYTDPLVYTDQPKFLNGSALVRTRTHKVDTVAALKKIEQQMGRQRDGRKNGPRKIDLDLILFNGHIIDDDLRERDFLKRSVQEVLPDSELSL